MGQETKPLRILIVSTYFPPQNSVASFRPYSWAKRWTADGHHVTVLTTAKDRSDPTSLPYRLPEVELVEVPPPWLARWGRRSYVRARERNRPRSWFHWLAKIRTHLGIFMAARMPDLFDGWVKPAYTALPSHASWDVVVSTYGPYATHRLAYRLKQTGRVSKWVADFRDRWTDSEFFTGLFPFTVVERGLERRLMQRADLITAVTPPHVSDLSARYPGKRCHFLPNGFDRAVYADLDQTPFFPSDGRYRLVYTGMLYPRTRDPSPLLDAIRQLSQTEEGRGVLRRLEVVFASPHPGGIERLIDRYRVKEWVTDWGPVSHQDALRMQRDADVLLLFERADGTNIPAKLFEYLVASAPIWAIGLDAPHPVVDILCETQRGMVVKNLADALRSVVTNCPSQSFSKKTHEISAYDRDQLASQLLGLINEIQCGDHR